MEKIHSSIIIEILGRPPEHITEALNMLINKLDSEKGFKVLNKICHEPKQAKDSQDLYTTFAEVELELESVLQLFGVIFGYMPSHVEIINPEKISISNVELSEITTKLSERLHDYDAIAKRLVVERDELAKKLYEVAPHLFKKPEENKTQQENKKEKNKKVSKKKRKKQS